MNESEFRDWCRRQLGSFDGRMKALEGKVGNLVLAPPRVREREVLSDMAELAAKLGVVINGGTVTALGIVFLTEDGAPHTGFKCESFEKFSLAGAVGQLWLEVMGQSDASTAESEPQADVRETPRAGEAADPARARGEV